MGEGINRIVVTEELEVPDMEGLARLYRDAIANEDVSLAGACEGAAMKFAAAEGSLAEALALARFASDSAG